MEHLPFEVKAILGRAELSMGAYHHLRVGDILILDQKVEEPLSVTLAEEEHYRGVPGLIETRKAVKIDERVYPG